MNWKYLENYHPNTIQLQCNWMEELAQTPQDPIFHAEGDVATHTFMVLEELQGSPFFQERTALEKEILKAAALFHDIEKRSTTVIEANGRISSRGHAKKGALSVRKMLYQQGNTPFSIREQIAALVKYHGIPIWIFEKENPLKTLFTTSLALNTQLLGLLATADIKGRICADQEEMLYKIALFQAYCEEQECWGVARTFETSLAKFHYFQKDNAPANYIPFEKETFEVVLMCGLPGTGKDHHIQQKYPDWPVISLDSIRKGLKIAAGDKKQTGKVVATAKEQAKIYLRKKQRFVWNATNVTRKMRKQLIDAWSVYRPKICIDYVEVPFQKLLVQNQARTAIVPFKVIENMLSKLEIPTADEAHEVHYFISP